MRFLFTGGLETFFTVSEQTFIFLFSVLAGTVYGFFFDILRVIRIVFPFMRKKFPTAVLDFIFMLLFGFGIFLIGAFMGRGSVRFFYIAGAFLGAVLYLATVGNSVTGLIRRIFDRIFSDIKSKRRENGGKNL